MGGVCGHCWAVLGGVLGHFVRVRGPLLGGFGVTLTQACTDSFFVMDILKVKYTLRYKSHCFPGEVPGPLQSLYLQKYLQWVITDTQNKI